MFGCFLNPNYDVPGKVFVFTVGAIWTVSGYLFFRFIPNPFQWKQQEEVVEYIRENLME
ncbi:MAG: hypothetical protein VB086_12340 [Clostridiaceae bacterium]|nr:hypothetical protein [Clostridiaceae bacterium]